MRDRFPQLDTDKRTYHDVQVTSVLTNAMEQRPFEDHLINKLYPHLVETEGLLASKQRECRLPSLFLEMSMQS